MRYKARRLPDSLNNVELLEELHFIEKEGNRLVEQIQDAEQYYKHIRQLLEDRLEDLQYDYLQAETDRLESDGSKLDINTGIH